MWLAALCGWLTAATLGWLMILVFIERDNRRLDAGDAFEGDGVVRPPALFSADWVQAAVMIYGRIALIALAFALPLMFLVRAIERSPERGYLVWLMAGAAAMAPLTCAWLAIILFSPPTPWTIWVLPVLVLAILGMIGGAAARSVRYPKD